MSVITVCASKPRVLVALSGGVDSSVCAILLAKQGYEVAGVCMEFSPHHAGAVRAARKTAEALGIPFFAKKVYEDFSRKVIDPFCEAYRAGKTPNPCVICNPLVKFEALCAVADEEGFPFIATGHYAGVVCREGRYAPRRSRCVSRDQSYMLYRLTQRQLARLLLPLEEMEKDAVRKDAADAGLLCWDAPDSQEICFVDDRGYPALIEERFGPCPEGDLIGPDGTVVGRHRGIVHYTVGQRKGLGVSLGRPVFIRRISPLDHRIHLVFEGHDRANGVSLTDCVYPLFETPPRTFRADVKIRSMAKPVQATVEVLEHGAARVLFDEPQRAPAPGQSAVLYEGDVVAGGGLIEDWIDEER